MANPFPSITAISDDSSLLAVHTPPPPPSSTTQNNTKKRIVIRCYDTSLSAGTLRFTLSTTLNNDDVNNNNESSVVKQLLFLSSTKSEPPSHLCALLSQSSSILVWDLNRGVLIHTLVPFLPKELTKRCTLHSLASSCSQEKQEEGEGALCLYALVTRKEKAILYEYNITTGKLVRKIKGGSTDDDDDDEMEEEEGNNSSKANVNAAAVVSGGKKIFAIRHANHVRVMDENGSKLKKFSLEDDDDDNNNNNESDNTNETPIILFSPDGKMLLTSHGSSHLHLFNMEKGKKCGIMEFTKESSSLDTTISNVHVIHDAQFKGVDDNEDEDTTGYNIVLTTSTGTTHLYQATSTPLSKKKKKKKKNKNTNRILLPSCTIQSSRDEKTSIANAHFHSVKPNEKLVLTFLPHSTTTDATTGAVVKASSSSVMDVRDFSYRTERGEITTGNIFLKKKEETVGKEQEKKRKVESTNVVALGPGDIGGEAIGASDIMVQQQQQQKQQQQPPPPLKKQKMNQQGEEEEDEDEEFRLPYDDDDDDEENEEGKSSIGERLKLLSTTLDDPTDSESEDDDNDDDDDDDNQEAKDSKKKQLTKNNNDINNKKRLDPNTATSESLSTLLTQALTSNDDAQLEIALHVTDMRTIQSSIASLVALDDNADDDDDDDNKKEEKGAEMLSTLLAKLVTRLARSPSRAQMLGGWVRTVLVAINNHHASTSNDGGKKMKKRFDVAARLGPLRNLLNERVENYPHLLRLEGRLALLENRG